MIKVLFVCLGNICRSPMGEALFKDLLAQKGLSDKFVVESCGTTDFHTGEDADPRTLETLEANGLSLDHTARPLRKADFDAFDYIIAMDEKNLANIEALRPESSRAEVFLLRELAGDDDNLNVPDPYWSGKDGFNMVFNIVQEGCGHLLEYIRKHHDIKT